MEGASDMQIAKTLFVKCNFTTLWGPSLNPSKGKNFPLLFFGVIFGVRLLDFTIFLKARHDCHLPYKYAK